MRTRTIFSTALLVMGIVIGVYNINLVTPVGAQGEGDVETSAATVDAAISTGFTYQGQLMDNEKPANGSFDFQFILYDTLTGGNQQGGTVTELEVAVSNGLFNVSLDFGQSVFNGEQRFIEVGVKPAGSSSDYTILSPRSVLSSVPYALALPWSHFDGHTAVVEGNLTVDGNIHMTGTDFAMGGPNSSRGDRGRAIVHGDGDTLILNFGPDFAGGTIIDGNLQVHGEIRGKMRYSDEYSWDKSKAAVQMIHKDRGFCFLTRVGGKFEGTAEFVQVYIAGDNHWYLAGLSGQPQGIEARARCVGNF
ncbi:MAG: hypothetical protein AAF702_05120 [Chloroflexota bacterium]